MPSPSTSNSTMSSIDMSRPAQDHRHDLEVMATLKVQIDAKEAYLKEEYAQYKKMCNDYNALAEKTLEREILREAPELANKVIFII